jgi:hypothetical protein
MNCSKASYRVSVVVRIVVSNRTTWGNTPEHNIIRRQLMNQKRKKRKLTPSSIVGFLIGFWLIGTGLYYALACGKPGAYFVAVLGLILNAMIYWSYRA